MPLDADSSPSTSASLILRVKARDNDAWERLVAVYTPLVYRWCRKDGLQVEECLDLVQEVFQAVLRGIDSFEKIAERDTFRGGIRRTAMATKPIEPHGLMLLEVEFFRSET